MCLESFIDQQTRFLLEACGCLAEHILPLQYVLFSRSEEAWQTLSELSGQVQRKSVCVLANICWTIRSNSVLSGRAFSVSKRETALRDKLVKMDG